MIPFDEIDNRLKLLKKDRPWLVTASGRSAESIRAALAPNAPASKRSALLQKALSDVIIAEEQRQNAPQSAEVRLAPGFFAIFKTEEQIAIADQASRLVGAASLEAFCRDAIQAEARRLIAQHSKLAPMEFAQTEEPTNVYWLDLVGGVAAGAPVSSDITPEPIAVTKQYSPACYALRVFGRSAEPTAPDGSTIVVERLPEGTYPKKGKLVVYRDAHGASLKVFGYRKAKAGEEGNNFGQVPVLSSLNPEFPDVTPLDNGRIDAVFVDRVR